jgi:predicted enzyme related to lactoylglutathione lyase
MNKSIKIDYVEFQTRDLEATKAFFRQAFGWEFVDYGPDYASFSDQGVNGGFYRAEQAASVASGSALVILYSAALEETQARVKSAGGTIIKEIFSFPGGHRFHFREPGGNELAVWSDAGAD